MFKYPSPWQVLCSSLEKRDQVQENGEDGSADIKEDPTGHYATDGTAFHVETSIEHQIVSSSETKIYKEPETEVRRREISGDQETSLHADSSKTHVPEEQEDDVTTMDRVTRRTFSSSIQSLYGSQQDLANSSEGTEKDVWPSPRDRGLKLLRETERFEIRSHLPETSPTKLFADSDGDDDDKYRPRSRELTPEKVQELEKNRRDIIKKQGQRKSLDTEDAMTMNNSDLAGVDGGADKPNVHTEQIHFESARQQFLKLEKERNSLPITPRPLPRQSRLSTHRPRENDQVATEQEDRESTASQEMARKNKSSGLLRKQFFKSFSMDSVDSWEEEKSAPEIPEEKGSTPNPGDETPIEREIRLALEREQSLRRERGIPSSGETKEIIEISKNPVLANSTDLPHSRKGKNRRQTSLIQKEIEKEVRREDDLKSEGRVAGLYDKGDSQELDERRKVFEQPDDIPVQPQQGSGTRTPKETAYNAKEDTSQAEPLTDDDTKNWTVSDSAQPYSVRMKWKPTPFNAYRSRRLSSENILDIKTPPERPAEKETSDETFTLRKENFHFKPLKFSLRVQGNEGEVGKDNKTGQKERYNTRLRPSLSNIIEQEIQKTLERDRELQEERRKSGLLPLSTHTDDEVHRPHNGYDAQGTSPLPSDSSHSWSSAPWRGTLGDKMPSYDSSTVQILRPHGYPMFEVSESDGDRLKRHENRYAGIDSSDDVNTEIVESTRVNRHKNTMALRWEAGLFANEQSE